MARVRPPRSFLGLRVAALAEIAVFLLAALAIDAQLGAGDRFASLAPHPFWIIVVLVAAQYGAKEGLAAALAAAAALLAGNLPEQGFSEDLHAWLLRATTQPILWVFAAIVLGEIRDGNRRERDRLRDELAEVRHQAEGVVDAYHRLSALKDHLEARVAGQSRTVHSIFVATRAIERHDTGEVLAGVQRLVAQVMAPRKFSLFLLNGGTLEAVLSEGWTEEDEFAEAFAASSPIFQAVVSHGRFLVTTRPSHGLILDAEGLLAGPLACAETGEVIGMLKIEEMDFLDLNPANAETFQVLCGWIGAAYSRARRLEAAGAECYFDPVRCLLPAAMFELQRDVAIATAQRIGFDLSVVLVALDLPKQAAPGLQPLGARAVSRAVAALRLHGTLCFDWRRDGWDVAVLLPGASGAEAEELAARLVSFAAGEPELNEFRIGLRGEVQDLHAVPPTLDRTMRALRQGGSTAA